MNKKILKAKEKIYNFLKEQCVYGHGEKDFFKATDENTEEERILFSLETYDIPYLFISLMNEKLKGTGCCIEYDNEDSIYISMAIAKKEEGLD